MLLAISMIGVSETMNLGIHLGLDPKLLKDILRSGHLLNYIYNVYYTFISAQKASLLLSENKLPEGI